MKKLKLNILQIYQLRLAHTEAHKVLREIKAKPLAGEALAEMKNLETAIGLIESILIGL